MGTRVKPKLVSVSELDGMVNNAVEIAAKRLELKLKPGNLVHKWDLVGRQVRDVVSAQKFSAEMAKQLNKDGLQVKPAVSIINKQIIAGFIQLDRIALPSKLI